MPFVSKKNAKKIGKFFFSLFFFVQSFNFLGYLHVSIYDSCANICNSCEFCANFFGLKTGRKKWDFHGFCLSFCSWVGAILRFNLLRSAQASLLSHFAAFSPHCVPQLFPSFPLVCKNTFFLLSLDFARKNLLITEKSSLRSSKSPPTAQCIFSNV